MLLPGVEITVEAMTGVKIKAVQITEAEGEVGPEMGIPVAH